MTFIIVPALMEHKHVVKLYEFYSLDFDLMTLVLKFDLDIIKMYVYT